MTLHYGPQDELAGISKNEQKRLEQETYECEREKAEQANVERPMYIVTPPESRRSSEVVAMQVRASRAALARYPKNDDKD